MPIVNRVANLQTEIAAWRHDLHAHPELLYEVHRTAASVAEKLQAFGCDEVVSGIGRTGVVGVIKGNRAGGVRKVTGLRADPESAAYCASKAAINVYLEGLRIQLRDHGIPVTVICPGFVATPMTAVNDFPMPFLMTALGSYGLPRKAAPSLIKVSRSSAASAFHASRSAAVGNGFQRAPSSRLFCSDSAVQRLLNNLRFGIVS